MHELCDRLGLTLFAECLVYHREVLYSFCADTRERVYQELILREARNIETLTTQYFEKILQRLLSDLASWDVHDTLQTHHIERIEYNANICKNIFYLSAFVKLHTSEYLVWDVLSDEGFFYETRLSVGTIEYSEVRICLILGITDSTRDELCFMFFIESIEYDYLLTNWIGGKKCLLHLIGIILDDCIGSIDNNLC